MDKESKLIFEAYLEDNIMESLALKGDYKGIIFQRLVAAQYMVMPSITPEDKPAWDELIAKFKKQENFVKSKFTKEPIDGDPYSSSKDLSRKVQAQRDQGIKKPNVKVYATPPSGAEDDPDTPVGHPHWSNGENVSLRWVHDIITHLYKGHKFSARGEYAAFNTHTKTLGPETAASEALFTEVVAQTSCYYVLGDFVEQKATLMTDMFDHTNVGALNPDSTLNNFFVLHNKELIKRPDFNEDEFIKTFPELAKELDRHYRDGKAITKLQPIFSWE